MRELKILNKAFAHSLYLAHARTQFRISINRKIKELAENGEVAIVESGIDCDCVRYFGHVRTVKANVKEFWKEVQRMYLDAEGRIDWCVERPSVVANLVETTQDLILEAYENGRGNSIYV